MTFAGSEVGDWRNVVGNGKRIKVPLGHTEGAGHGCSWDWGPWVCGGHIWMLAQIVERIRGIDKGIVTMVMPCLSWTGKGLKKRTWLIDLGSWEVLVTCKCHVYRGVSWQGRQWWAECKAGAQGFRAGGHPVGQGAMREKVLAGGTTWELKGPGSVTGLGAERVRAEYQHPERIWVSCQT